MNQYGNEDWGENVTVDNLKQLMDTGVDCKQSFMESVGIRQNATRVKCFCFLVSV